MYNTSLRIVNNNQEAEDIMQESFLSAFENIETYGGKVSFGAWLKRIVINRSLDALKRRKIDLLCIDDAEELPDEADEDTDEEAVHMQVEKIHRCIRMLPDGYRIILGLYLLDGYDHKEISEILDISESTSRSQYYRARNKLAGLFRESGKI